MTYNDDDECTQRDRIERLETLVGKRHEENKAALARLQGSVDRALRNIAITQIKVGGVENIKTDVESIKLTLAEQRGGKHTLAIVMSVVSALVIPFLVVGVQMLFKVK